MSQSEYLKKLEAIYKAAATDFKINGVLTDQQTRAWFTHLFTKDAFLGKVSRELRAELTGNTGFIDAHERIFTRVAEGEDDVTVGEGTHHSQRYSKYNLLEVDVRAFVGYSVIDDNPSADLLNKINGTIDQGSANSLLDLAINGEDDVFNGGAPVPFLTLGKGWVKLAKDSGTINKVLLVADDDRLDDLDQLVLDMLLELPQEHRDRGSVIMSDNERLKRMKKLADTASGDARSIALAAMSDSTRNSIHGKPIECPHYWPDQFFMLTDPKNLEIDMHNKVRRSIEEKVRRKGFEYTYHARVDQEIIHHAEACVAYIP